MASLGHRVNCVFITGGASGIGWAAAQEFLRCGWSVAIGDIDTAMLRSRDADLSDKLVNVELDVTSEVSIRRALDLVTNRFGRLDAFVNNAGIQQWTSIEDLDWRAWQAVLDVNLHGVLRCLHAVGRYMLSNRRGSIVNITSVNSERGVAHRAPYSASKAAVLALTRTAAIEWAAHGVRVNAVGPGYVATELIETFVKSGKLDARPITDRIPLGRMAEPAEIARAIRFLCSDDSSYITGQVLYVDGGLLASSGIAAGNQNQSPGE
jgi:3-oxoacyl-[acyl-carrier protein] reductase